MLQLVLAEQVGVKPRGLHFFDNDRNWQTRLALTLDPYSKIQVNISVVAVVDFVSLTCRYTQRESPLSATKFQYI